MQRESNDIAPDQPISAPDDDILGFAPFAQYLADALFQSPSTEGFVVGIYGTWGSGKSSLLNLLTFYLEQKPDMDTPIVMRFNPWWFSGHEDLTKRFFEQLRVEFEKWKVVSEAVQKQFADFADSVSESGIPIPIPYAKEGLRLFARATRPKDRDLVKLRKTIEEALRKQSRRILVIIDDVDRLTSTEIRQLFGVIKASANFPNLVYLVAFDRNVVTRALSEEGMQGDDYLEKIVQVSFELPELDREALDWFLSSRLSEVTSYVLLPAVRRHWDNTYYGSILPLIETPRDVVRLSNSVGLLYPAVRREVSPADFVALETLRLFCPSVYETIRTHKENFAGRSADDPPGPANEILRTFHNDWLEKISTRQKDTVKRTVMRMFPKLEAVWGNMYYGLDVEYQWQRMNRICSWQRFDIYFQITAPSGSVSNAEIEELLWCKVSKRYFGAKILEIATKRRRGGYKRVSEVLSRLADYTDPYDIEDQYVHFVIRALLDVGDSLVKHSGADKDYTVIEVDMRIWTVIWKLLSRYDEPHRFDILNDAIQYVTYQNQYDVSPSDTPAVSVIVEVVNRIEAAHGLPEGTPAMDSEQLVALGHVNALREAALTQVRRVAADGDALLQTPNLRSTLVAWQRWTDKDEVRDWVSRATEPDRNLAVFLAGFMQRLYSETAGDAVKVPFYRLDPQWTEPFIDAAQVAARVRGMTTGREGMLFSEQMALNQFLQEFAMRQSGRDPNLPHSWFE